MTIELIGVAKRYANIENLNLTLKDGSATALVGESGSGKSTIARLISLLEPPDAGEIRFGAQNTANLRGETRRRLRADMQLILQNAPAALDPRVRVGQSIAEPLRNLTHRSPAEIEARVLAVCTQFSLPHELLARLPHELSGGQLKRVCFARAFATQPSFVVFDETTSGLNPSLREHVLDIILDLKRESLRSFLFITHDMDAALRVADRVLVMRAGAIVEDAPIADRRADFHHEYARLLLQSTI